MLLQNYYDSEIRAMVDNNPIKKSIKQKMDEERYKIPSEKENKKYFDIQMLLVLSILLSTILGLISAIKLLF